MKSATDLVTSHEGLDKIDTKILRVLQADGWAAADSVDIKPGSDCGADRQLSGDTVDGCSWPAL